MECGRFIEYSIVFVLSSISFFNNKGKTFILYISLFVIIRKYADVRIRSVIFYYI